MKGKDEPVDVDLYKVFLKGDVARTGTNDRPVYLGKGVDLEEAERISRALAAESYVKRVYLAREDDDE